MLDDDAFYGDARTRLIKGSIFTDPYGVTYASPTPVLHVATAVYGTNIWGGRCSEPNELDIFGPPESTRVDVYPSGASLFQHFQVDRKGKEY